MNIAVSNENVSDELISRILDTFQDAVVWITTDSRIVQWNHAAESVFGFKRDEVLHKSLVNTIIPDHHRANHARGMKNYMERGVGPLLGHTVEIDAVTRSGTAISIAITIDEISVGGDRYFTSHIRPLSEIPLKV